jgi:hypothetical protein
MLDHTEPEPLAGEPELPEEPAEPRPKRAWLRRRAAPAPAPAPKPEPLLEHPEPEPVADEPERPKLEPLEAPVRRRWFRRRTEPAPEPELPPPPKHVRLLPPAPRQDRVAGEVAEIFDAEDREEEKSRR